MPRISCSVAPPSPSYLGDVVGRAPRPRNRRPGSRRGDPGRRIEQDLDGMNDGGHGRRRGLTATRPDSTAWLASLLSVEDGADLGPCRTSSPTWEFASSALTTSWPAGSNSTITASSSSFLHPGALLADDLADAQRSGGLLFEGGHQFVDTTRALFVQSASSTTPNARPSASVPPRVALHRPVPDSSWMNPTPGAAGSAQTVGPPRSRRKRFGHGRGHRRR